MKPAFKAPDIVLGRSRESRGDTYGLDPAAIASDTAEQLSLERVANAVLTRENRFVQRMLDDRDRQLSDLQAEVAAMRRDWAWRSISAIRTELRRLRRIFSSRDSIAARATRTSDSRAHGST